MTTLTGKNGLFTRTKQAKQNTIDAQELENSTLSDYKKQIDDVVGNKKEVEETDIYVKLYTDGTLTFSSTDKVVEGKSVTKSYGNIRGITYTKIGDILWKDDVENITNIEIIEEIVPISTAFWFATCQKVTNIDLKKLNTSKVIDMQYMFAGCGSLTNIDTSKFDTSRVTNMYYMFFLCNSLTNIDTSKFDTSKVTNMAGMFGGCSSLTKIDLSKFDTSKVTAMNDMFNSCSGLTNIDLSKFDTSKVTNMSDMFRNCTNLTSIYVSPKWVTTNVTSNTDMFTGCGTNEVTMKNTN